MENFGDRLALSKICMPRLQTIDLQTYNANSIGNFHIQPYETLEKALHKNIDKQPQQLFTPLKIRKYPPKFSPQI